MSLVTRCPACATPFKVVPDQLRISDGWVRCGRCSKVFDATLDIDRLVDDALPVPASVPAVDVETPVSVTGADVAADVDNDAVLDVDAELEAGPVPTDAREDEDFLDEDRPSGLEPARDVALPFQPIALPASALDLASPAPAPMPAPASVPPPPPPPPPPLVSLLAPMPTPLLVSPAARVVLPGVRPDEPLIGVVADDPWPVASQAPNPVSVSPSPAVPPPLPAPAPAPAPTVRRAKRDDAPPVWRTPSEEPSKTRSVAASALPPPAPAPAPVRPAVSASMPTVRTASETDAPAADGAASGPAVIVAPVAAWAAEAQVPVATPDVPSRGHRRAWVGLGIASAAVLLVAQWTFQQRDAIAAYRPALRPILARACTALGCELAALRRIGDITVDGAAFAREKTGDGYRLSFTLRNAASVPLAMPAVELSLLDTQEQAVVRRVLTPAEFGAPALLPARSDRAASLALALGGTEAAALPPVAGYRLIAFYP